MSTRYQTNTASTRSAFNQLENDTICSIYFRNETLIAKSGEIGISIFDFQTYKCFLCQFSEQNYTQYNLVLNTLSTYLPKLIIISDYKNDGLENQLISQIKKLKERILKDDNQKENQQVLKIVPIAKRLFSSELGKDSLGDFALPNQLTSLKISTNEKDLSFYAFNGLINYLSNGTSLNVNQLNKSLHIQWLRLDQIMIIDAVTASMLELVDSKVKDGISLFSLLSINCGSLMGKRRLYKSILQPLTSLEQIKFRQNLISFLQKQQQQNSQKFDLNNLKFILNRNFNEFESLICDILKFQTNKDSSNPLTVASSSINIILKCKTVLDGLPKIANCLNDLTQKFVGTSEESETDSINFLRALRLNCESLESKQLSNEVIEVLNTEQQLNNKNGGGSSSSTKARFQRLFAIKSSLNSLFNVARITFNEVSNDIFEHLQELNDTISAFATTEFPKIKLKENSNRKNELYIFQINFQEKDSKKIKTILKDQIPNIHFKESNRKSKSSMTNLEFSTLHLIKLNERLKEAEIEIQLSSEKILEDLILGPLKSNVFWFHNLVDNLSFLDMINALAIYSKESESFYKPEFNEFCLTIKQGRNPLLESMLNVSTPHRRHSKHTTFTADNTNQQIVANDIHAISENAQFCLITGPNMSGKSSYLFQVCYLQILAQLGSFLPCEFASIKICKQLFARLSFNDNLEVSTFGRELSDMAFILENCTKDDLIIVDELGRGTSRTDALGLTFAICEKLIILGPLTFFTTHFKELADVLSNSSSVITLNFGDNKQQQQQQGNQTSDFLLSPSFQLQSGLCNRYNYGIDLAKTLRFPSDLIETAYKVSKTLTEHQISEKENSIAYKEQKKQKQIELTVMKLIQLFQNKNNNLEDIKLSIPKLINL